MLSPRAAEAVRRAPLRFYDGTSETGETPVWLATQGANVDGTLGGLGALDESGQGGRVNGALRSGAISAKVFNVRNQRVGSLSGTFVEGAPSGTFRLGSNPAVNWSAEPVVADTAAIASLGGGYRAEGIPSPAVVTVGLNARKRTFNILGNARIGIGTVNIVRITGKWIADGNGNLWLLATTFKYNRLPGAPSLPFPLPRDGAIAKLAFVVDGNLLTLSDTANPEIPLITLRRN